MSECTYEHRTRRVNSANAEIDRINRSVSRSDVHQDSKERRRTEIRDSTRELSANYVTHNNHRRENCQSSRFAQARLFKTRASGRVLLVRSTLSSSRSCITRVRVVSFKHDASEADNCNRIVPARRPSPLRDGAAASSVPELPDSQEFTRLQTHYGRSKSPFLRARRHLRILLGFSSREFEILLLSRKGSGPAKGPASSDRRRFQAESAWPAVAGFTPPSEFNPFRSPGQPRDAF